MIPKNLKYTEEHEWVRVEDDSATIGISDYAQEALGDITFVELPEIGKQVAQFEDLAVIESVKAASDIYAPLSGKVLEVNPALEEAPETINQDCYGEGWICKLSGIVETEMEKLLSAEAYEKLIASE
ncbi:MAG: glycine cleavage system protein GcvH [Candidatus Latescibacteria bacterium]|nr:glycine cleavage system protein GcvH [Candidatus Latescibacterota bacterium]OPX23980.1 MAG: glycine cleavage system protein H [Candidatus Latescibacteria bacterium 4484_107]